METRANTAFALLADWLGEERCCKALPAEGLAAYQLAGGVTAYQGNDA